MNVVLDFPVQAVFFGALAMSTLRMKYLWTPYMCILAGFGVADYKAWKTILCQLNTQGIVVCTCMKSVVSLFVLWFQCARMAQFILN